MKTARLWLAVPWSTHEYHVPAGASEGEVTGCDNDHIILTDANRSKKMLALTAIHLSGVEHSL